jgi:solute carrier family 25 (mitochondrial carnitine/acylcarnitine transporter), member 20/29
MSVDFWAGYISGAAGIVIGNPLDLLKTRLQAGDSNVHATSAESLRGTFDQAGTLVRGEFSFCLYFILNVFVA